jgi:hypothetical protein
VENDGPRRYPRRTILKGIGSIGLAAAVGPELLRLGFEPSNSSELLDALSGTLSPNSSVYLYRRDDLLTLRFDLYNLELDTSGASPVLVPISTSSPSWVVVVFPFQSIGEYTTFVSSTPKYGPTPVPALASGPTQLAFLLPAEVSSIPYTVTGLLDWTELSPLLCEVAQEAGAAPATDPTGPPSSGNPPLTYIEMAWQLLVSPDTNSNWISADQPLTYKSWTELWQARLRADLALASPLLYAVWTPNYTVTSVDTNSTQPDPFLMSLSDATNQTDGNNFNRLGLVAQSSESGGAGNQVAGGPALVSTFMLTALGATTEVLGTYPTGVAGIVSWTHRMSIGRDTFVRVVHAGYLFPFGHRAVLIQTIDREFQVSPENDVVAYLIEKVTVQVTEPVVVYPYPDSGAVNQFNDGRQNPFTSLEIKTLTTPPLDAATSIPGISPSTNAEWIMVDGEPFPFAMVGTDSEGRQISFNVGAIWVSSDLVSDTGTAMAQIGDLETSYAANPDWRSPTLDGQLVALAPLPTLDPAPGKTAFHLDSLIFDAVPHGASSADNGADSLTSPPWYPVMVSAQVRLPAVSQLSGAAGDDPTTPGPVVTYNSTYLVNGFPTTAGVPQVFLDLANAPALDFSQTGTQSAQSGTGLSGGVVSPNINIDGYAADLGPIADTAHMVSGTFNPKNFFSGVGALILGSVNLSDIIVPQSGGDVGPNAPSILNLPVYGKGRSNPPTATETTINWTPAIQDSGNFVASNMDTGDDAQLSVVVKILTPLNGSPPTTTVDGQLQNFTLDLFAAASTCVEIVFSTVHFSSRTGSKANVEVNVASVTFVNALSFVQDFEDLFKSLGGPSIDVEPSGITASYTVAIPSISLGVFALENLALGGSLNIPFTGQPVRLEVDFCSRDNPFLLSIYIFTGGGWLGIRLGADGIELVEIGLEFGVSCSINLGLASGGVSIMAGIYFALGTGTVTLTGFFKASGNLEVLGIISMSIVFYLGLTYQSPPAAAYGTASVTVTVSVLCFSASVSLTVTKQIAGGDPTIPFTDAISPADWRQFCASFA